jgi:hypothetical protein
MRLYENIYGHYEQGYKHYKGARLDLGRVNDGVILGKDRDSPKLGDKLGGDLIQRIILRFRHGCPSAAHQTAQLPRWKVYARHFLEPNQIWLTDSCCKMLPFLPTSSARCSKSLVVKSLMFIVGTNHGALVKR